MVEAPARQDGKPHLTAADTPLGPAEWARMYRNLGIQVVPSYMPSEQPGAEWKRPLGAWAKLRGGLAADETFDAWYGPSGMHLTRQNMGIVAGAASGGVFVIDIDTYKGREAQDWLDVLLEVHNSGLELETPKQNTGGGGVQLLFRAPVGWTPPTNRTAIGVDIRGAGGVDLGGAGGCAGRPPPHHSSGKPYEWVEGLAPWEVPIAISPGWLCSAIDKLIAESRSSPPPRASNDNRAHVDSPSGIATPQPASDFDDLGTRINGREGAMTGDVWRTVVNLHRASSIMPGAARLNEAMMDAFNRYALETKSRLPTDDAPGLTGYAARVELLQREGRGLTLFTQKWNAALAQWDGKVARAAAVPPPSRAQDDRAAPPAANDNDADARPPAFTDEALALKFTDHHADELRYVAGRGMWMRYGGQRWEADDTLFAYDLARKLCRKEAHGCNEVKIGKLVASAKTSSAIERLARSDRRLAAKAEQWDIDPWLLNTPAGVVDLQTGVIRSHAPTDYMTKITAVGPEGDCPIWKQHLLRVMSGDAELVGYLQRVFGYCLTGSTREHALFFAHGDGANGKSVTINTVAGILGDYQRSAPIETFTASHTDRHPTELAMLQGARIVTATETEEGRAWAEARIKSLTGGDRVSARYMRQDFFEFTPQFKLIIAGNHKPALRSVDEAIRRRFNMIPFTVTIPPEERDETLTERLKAEWPGILAWMIEGCRQWQRTGLKPPAAVVAATAEYLVAEDALMAWMDEACDRDKDWSDKTANLWASWKDWATRAGEQVGSLKRFSQNLKKHGFTSHRSNTLGRGFLGLRVRDERSST
jgi:putative DNA primase/helicase